MTRAMFATTLWFVMWGMVREAIGFDRTDSYQAGLLLGAFCIYVLAWESKQGDTRA